MAVFEGLVQARGSRRHFSGACTSSSYNEAVFELVRAARGLLLRLRCRAPSARSSLARGLGLRGDARPRRPNEAGEGDEVFGAVEVAGAFADLGQSRAVPSGRTRRVCRPTRGAGCEAPVLPRGSRRPGTGLNLCVQEAERALLDPLDRDGRQLRQVPLDAEIIASHGDFTRDTSERIAVEPNDEPSPTPPTVTLGHGCSSVCSTARSAPARRRLRRPHEDRGGRHRAPRQRPHPLRRTETGNGFTTRSSTWPAPPCVRLSIESDRTGAQVVLLLVPSPRIAADRILTGPRHRCGGRSCGTSPSRLDRRPQNGQRFGGLDALALWMSLALAPDRGVYGR